MDVSKILIAGLIICIMGIPSLNPLLFYDFDDIRELDKYNSRADQIVNPDLERLGGGIKSYNENPGIPINTTNDE